MKKIARLIMFFSFSFILFLVLFVLFRFIGFWIESIQSVSMDAVQGVSLIRIINLALPETLFFTILFSLSYSVRHKVSALLSILFLLTLSGGFCLGFYTGIERIEAMKLPFFSNTAASGSVQMKPGIILSRQDMDMVLLKEDTAISYSGVPGIAGFPRVVSFPERPLIYHETAIGRDASFFDLEMGDTPPWFFQSILIDFNLTGRELDSRYKQGIETFFIYGFSLIFLLVSLRFLFELSLWPLANLFLGAVIFRAVLSLEIFLISPETQNFIRSFLSERVGMSVIPPLVFFTLGVLVLLYTFLSFLARRRRRDDA